jgi:hypothetical protein
MKLINILLSSVVYLYQKRCTVVSILHFHKMSTRQQITPLALHTESVEVPNFDDCSISWKCGDSEFSCKICKEHQCFERFGVRVYVNDKMIDFAKDSELLKRTLSQMYSEKFQLNIGISCPRSDCGDHYNECFRSVTVTFFNTMNKINSPMVKIVLFNEHNGCYPHSYQIEINKKMVGCGKL